ncbi:MAG: type II toxin-antitoxin system RelE/ParE family toxin [Halohasta sp.]
MPTPPSALTLLQSARDDLAAIQQHNPDHAERILRKINDWSEKIQWGRIPQQHLVYLTGSDRYNFYRERVGNAGYRVIYELSDDEMTVVGIVPKGENTYDLAEFRRRLDE